MPMLTTTDGNILIVAQRRTPKGRSRLVDVFCTCKRRRKDGTCKHYRGLVGMVEPQAAARLRVVTVEAHMRLLGGSDA